MFDESSIIKIKISAFQLHTKTKKKIYKNIKGTWGEDVFQFTWCIVNKEHHEKQSLYSTWNLGW